jgi:hypothetical protein
MSPEPEDALADPPPAAVSEAPPAGWGQGRSLTREQILARRNSHKPVREWVPEWGGDVWIRVLSAADQVEIAEAGGQAALGPARVLVAALVDEGGARLFTDEDLPELMKEDFPVIMRLFQRAAKVNGLTSAELDEAMASFDFTQGGDASTGSP